MGIMDGFTPDYDYNWSIAKGEHEVRIISVEERKSRNDNLMLAVKLETELGNTLFYNIIKNHWFNKNMTRFMDCFHIPVNVLNMQLWLNRKDRVYVDKGELRDDGKQFMEIKYLIVPQGGQKTQPEKRVPNTTLVKEENCPIPDWPDDGSDDISF
jgi:hypothetical protein